MAWEKRGNHRSYTRTHRVKGGFRRVYIGVGELAEVAAAADAFRRFDREVERRSWDEERRRGTALIRAQREFNEWVKWFSKAMILGYLGLDSGIQHGGKYGMERKANSSDWRRSTSPEVDLSRFKWLVQRAEKGEEAAMPEIRRLLDLHPEYQSQVRDLGSKLQEAILEALSGKDLFLKESLERQAQQMRRELASAQPLPLEKLQVEHVVACWLLVQHATAMTIQGVPGKTNERIIRELQARQKSAERSFQSAVHLLAQVQNLFNGPKRTRADQYARIH